MKVVNFRDYGCSDPVSILIDNFYTEKDIYDFLDYIDDYYLKNEPDILMDYTEFTLESLKKRFNAIPIDSIDIKY